MLEDTYLVNIDWQTCTQEKQAINHLVSLFD